MSHVSPVVVAIVGPTATGKSALGIALAQRFGGEVVNCDSTAVYRGFDIGTDKVASDERQGVPHHLIDIVEPSETYSAARYARDAAAIIHDIVTRGRLPIVVGGTGLYYRALTRGLFPGPARDDRLRGRLETVARRHGVERLHRLLREKDPASGARVLPRDLKRIVRALEVYYLTGRPISDHFADTRSPLEGHEVVTLAISLSSALIGERVARRVDLQFDRGIVQEVRRLLDAGVPDTAHPFSGLVYKQVLEFLHGVRDEAATRALIVQENRRYARRQLIWFRKEPNLLWLHEPGEASSTIERAVAALRERGVVR
ncbi:MAG: miaA [Acidobacteria bacterium]|jgi:tRNA dimethylallyltransferase|nr:miaA [Acidobacteriota bacterium]